MRTFFEDLKYVLKSISLLDINKKDVIILLIFTIVSNVIMLFQPLIFGQIINAITDKSLNRILTNIYSMFVLFLLSIVFLFLKNRKNIKIISTVEMKIKEHTLQGILESDYQKIMENSSGKLINIIDQDAMTFSNMLTFIIGLIIDILSFMLTLLIMFFINIYLSIAVLIIFPLMMILYFYIGKKIKAQEYLLKKSHDDYMLFLTESFNNSKILKIFNRETFRVNQFKNILNKVYKIGIKKVYIETYADVCLNTILFVSQVTILVLGILLIFRGYFTIGMLVSFNSYSENFKQSALNISKLNNTFQSITVSLERILDFFNESPTTQKKSESTFDPSSQIESIILKDINVTINDNKILSMVNATFKSGTINLICGPSGSGKTTLFNIISQLNIEYEGNVFFDKENIKDIPNSLIRKYICFVPQENLIFSATILENLTLGDNTISQEEIETVCNLLDIQNFISSLDDGYNTVLKNSGKSISGGQAQRICIARALLKNSSIYIFDEVISSLDKKNAENVIKIISDLAKHKIVIMSSHQTLNIPVNKFYLSNI